MDTEIKNDFYKKIADVCKEFGVENVSISGNRYNQFIGVLSIDKDTPSILDAVMNVGRLWQHSRTVIRDMLNDFEK